MRPGEQVFAADGLAGKGVAQLQHELAGERKQTLAKPIAETFLKRVRAGEDDAKVAKELNLAHREFGPFTRINPPLTDPTVVGTAFGLDEGQRSGLLETPDGMYVMKVLKHTEADSAAFAKSLEEYRSKMINLVRQDRIRGYMGALRQAAKIVDNRAKLQQRQQEFEQTAQQPPGI